MNWQQRIERRNEIARLNGYYAPEAQPDEAQSEQPSRDEIETQRIAEAQATLAFIEDVKAHFNGDVMHVRWWEGQAHGHGVYGYGGQSIGRMF